MGTTLHVGQNEAIVIGASMAGLLAARVLADKYHRVTILERDSLPSGRDNRRGVPQGKHTHGLLASGRETLENLFPGIGDELVASGAVPGDILRDAVWFIERGCHCKAISGLNGLLMSRPFLEGMVRERVRKLPNVTFRENENVVGLGATRDRTHVIGVDTDHGILPADLVVDAAGRGSHSVKWLEKLGYSAPREERVEIGLSYATRLFRRRSTDLSGDMAAIIPPEPFGTRRGGVMLAQEDDRWTVTLISHFGPPPPSELAGFIDFAESLPASYIHEVIRSADPIGDPAVTRFPASVRRRYEELERFPEGYLVFGDAISSFNPIYGQGMSVAALEAMELKAALRHGTADLAKRFFKRASRVIDIPWSIAVGNDLRMPQATGPRNVGVKIINAYIARMHKAAHADPSVAIAFHRVGNLLAPPPSIMHPRIAMRVLWHNLRPHSELQSAPKAMKATTVR